MNNDSSTLPAPASSLRLASDVCFFRSTHSVGGRSTTSLCSNLIRYTLQTSMELMVTILRQEELDLAEDDSSDENEGNGNAA